MGHKKRNRTVISQEEYACRLMVDYLATIDCWNTLRGSPRVVGNLIVLIPTEEKETILKAQQSLKEFGFDATLAAAGESIVIEIPTDEAGKKAFYQGVEALDVALATPHDEAETKITETDEHTPPPLPSQQRDT
jgi:hypothetical protein